MAHKVPLVQQVLRDRKVLLVLRDRKVHKVFRVHKVMQVQQVPLEQPVLLE
jgi:hypothetical protein